jgi:hypothetical protein
MIVSYTNHHCSIRQILFILVTRSPKILNKTNVHKLFELVEKVIFFFIKVQLFCEGLKNLLNRPNDFDVYLLVKISMMIEHIFVAFSEKLNFNLNKDLVSFFISTTSSTNSLSYQPIKKSQKVDFVM